MDNNNKNKQFLMFNWLVHLYGSVKRSQREIETKAGEQGDTPLFCQDGDKNNSPMMVAFTRRHHTRLPALRNGANSGGTPQQPWSSMFFRTHVLSKRNLCHIEGLGTRRSRNWTRSCHFSGLSCPISIKGPCVSTAHPTSRSAPPSQGATLFQPILFPHSC